MLERKQIDYEKVVLIGVITKEQDEEKSQEYLDELEFLAYTAGGAVEGRFTQKVDLPNPKTYIGSGKMEELSAFVEENERGWVISDDEVTSAQQKNIGQIPQVTVLARTSLKPDICAQRAQTSYARTQV